MFHGSFTHLRSSLAAGLAVLALGASYHFKAPGQAIETAAFLGRWTNEGGAAGCAKGGGFVTFGAQHVQFSGAAAGLDFNPSHTFYRRSGNRLTLAMAMTSPDGEIDWNVDLAINRDGTLSFQAMSGAYVQLIEMAYGSGFEPDFAKAWGTLRRCAPVTAKL
jgi:hypothetical protein